jgi:hypothetical protein
MRRGWRGVKALGLSPRDRRTASSSFVVPVSCSPRRWPRRKHWRKCFALLLKATSRALVSFNLLGKWFPGSRQS